MHKSVASHVRHFLDLSDFTGRELRALLNHAVSLKADQQSGGTSPELQGKTLAMLFEKHSTRTRVSFELAMKQLGGYALELGANTSQMGRGESVPDTARVLARYVDVMMYRANSHEALLEMAEYSTVPVINGLTDWSHPCQALADILTFEEHKGSVTGCKLAWIGDCSNVARSLAHAAMLLDFHLVMACPAPYKPAADLMDWVKEQKEAGSKGGVRVLTAPEKAVKGVDAVITDTWVSMGDENAEAKLKTLEDYQVTEALMATADENAIFLHCLPAHRGEEVAAEVIDGRQSVVWDEAENRLHVQKAVLLWALNKLPQPTNGPVYPGHAMQE